MPGFGGGLVPGFGGGLGAGLRKFGPSMHDDGSEARHLSAYQARHLSAKLIGGVPAAQGEADDKGDGRKAPDHDCSRWQVEQC